MSESVLCLCVSVRVCCACVSVRFCVCLSAFVKPLLRQHLSTHMHVCVCVCAVLCLSPVLHVCVPHVCA